MVYVWQWMLPYCAFFPRSSAISRNCSRAASRSSTITWVMASSTIY